MFASEDWTLTSPRHAISALTRDSGDTAPVAYSTGSWTPIPREAGHRFHGKLDTDSTGSWTPIPREAGHPSGWPDLRGVLTEADAG